MGDLKEYRDKIDALDKKLVEIIEERMDQAIKVAEYKKAKGLEILNRAREEEVIRKNVALAKNKRYEPIIEEILETIMRQSRLLQRDYISDKKVVVGFQGVEGSNGEQALLQYFGEDMDRVAVKNFEDIFTELQNGNIEFGVLPIENSSTGGISQVYELLNKYSFYINGEISIKIDHHLMGLKGATVEEIKEVYSHPQGFAQCEEFLKYHSDWKQIPNENTASSAKFVKEKNEKSMAVIASEKVAKIYEMDVLESYINTNKNNRTRFAIIGKYLSNKEDNDKISVVLSTEHKAGSLFKVLQWFAENNINLTKIESRPLKSKPWEYYFYIDFEGNLGDEKLKQALEQIQKGCHYFKILGNYKSFRE